MSGSDLDTHGLSQRLDKKWTGGADASAGILTPEGTPGVDEERARSEKQRLAQEKRAEQGLADHGATQGAAEAQTSENSSAEQDGPKAEVLKEILSHPPQAFHKILGIPEDYDDKTQESRAVETAVYNRGTQVHPKHNKDRDAQEAWDSKQLLPAFRLLNAD
jgi:hypothetical protein